MTWHYAYSQDLWPAMISVALTVLLGLYGWYRRNVPGAKAFAIGCFLAMLWGIGTCLEIAASDFATKVFWIRFRALWQIPVVTALSCFFLEYAGLGRYLTRRNIILLSVPAWMIFLLMVTNDYHHLIWTSFSMDDSVVIQYGSATWVSIVYANLLGLVNFVALLRLAIGSPRSRWPVVIMVLGQFSGRIMFVLDSLNNRIFSPGESVLVVIGLSCSLYAFALFYFRVLDPVQLARSTVIEQLPDGMIVLDLQGRIVDLNPAVMRIFNQPASRLCGRQVVEVLPPGSGIETEPGRMELTKFEMSLGSDDATRYYRLSLTHLYDRRGERIGHLLLLHDTTGQRRSQELLMDQQMVVATLQERGRLARELHDSIGQVLGYISMQAQTVQKWVVTGSTEKALPMLNRLVEVAQEAHADVRESILTLSAGMTPEWTFFHALQRYLDHYRSSFGIGIELILSSDIVEDSLSPDAGIQVMRVIQEALTNARKHGDAHNVKVAFEQKEGHVVISIHDDGSGFDPADLDPDTGNHFGLLFMRERMAQIGGTVAIKSRPGSGTTVELDVPAGT